MALHIISADERLSTRQKVNIAIFGPFGVGKTTQLLTLPPADTLLIDMEAGDLAVQSFKGDTLKPRDEASAANVHPWQMVRAITCLLGGPDPSAAPGTAYARDQFDLYEQFVTPAATFDKYENVFTDSITVASRWCFSWAKTQPEAFSEKTGKPDVRGAYGLMGREMVQWLTHLQHIRTKNIIVVGILDQIKDDFGRLQFEAQIEGSKTGRELPGIFDEVLTLGLFDVSSGAPVLDLQKGTERGFICHKNNGYGVPAKDRSGRLNPVEAPDLGAIIRKIQQGERIDTLNTAAPVKAGE